MEKLKGRRVGRCAPIFGALGQPFSICRQKNRERRVFHLVHACWSTFPPSASHSQNSPGVKGCWCVGRILLIDFWRQGRWTGRQVQGRAPWEFLYKLFCRFNLFFWVFPMTRVVQQGSFGKGQAQAVTSTPLPALPCCTAWSLGKNLRWLVHLFWWLF